MRNFDKKNVFLLLFITFILFSPKVLYSQDNANSDTNITENIENPEDVENINTKDANDGFNIDDMFLDDESQDDIYDFEDLFLPEIIYNNKKVRVKNLGETSMYTPPKDPFLATVLSFMWMGLGQAYIGENPVASTILISAELTLIGLFIFEFFILQSQYSDYFDPMVRWEEVSGENKIMVVTTILTYVALKIFNVLDAHKQAVNYNRKYYMMGNGGYNSGESPYSALDKGYDIYMVVYAGSIGLKINF